MLKQKIEKFFTSEAFAVIGASSNRNKYGNKVLRSYIQNDKKVYPVNPKENTIENVEVIPSINDLPNSVQSVSIITPPTVTESVVTEIVKKGIKNVWIQPGAESEKAVQICLDNGINIIANGPCILVHFGFKENV